VSKLYITTLRPFVCLFVSQSIKTKSIQRLFDKNALRSSLLLVCMVESHVEASL